MSEKLATDFDHRIMDATSVALGGAVESTDKWTRIRDILLEPSEPQAACEIALAFIRWSQDLKKERNQARDNFEAMKQALEDAALRMQRARDILTNCKPTPDCNWGVLDTSNLRQVLANLSKEATS